MHLTMLFKTFLTLALSLPAASGELSQEARLKHVVNCILAEAPKGVSIEYTKLRFRYHLTGASQMTVQLFDLTDHDNRHIHLRDLKSDTWQTVYLDFTRDARRNDGHDTPFAAGHLVDDLFFFVQSEGERGVDLLIDEVVLFDAGKVQPD